MTSGNDQDYDSENYQLLDRLADEFVERRRRGDHPKIDEYVDAYPEVADEIRDLFPAMFDLERADEFREVGERRDPNASRSASLPAFTQVGDYRILREIGHGGMGVVYEAEQISLGRRVALKLLPNHVSRDPMMLERFRREARSAARLHHTNIVPVFEVGRDDTHCYYAMQFIQGLGLDRVYQEVRRLREQAGPKLLSVESESPGRSREVQEHDVDPGLLNPVVYSLLSGQFVGEVVLPAAQSSSNFVSDELDGANAELTKSERNSAKTGSLPHSTETPATFNSGARSEARGDAPGSSIFSSGSSIPSLASRDARYARSIARLGLQVAQGLAYAHERGVIHRDIKPSNLLLDISGVVWITDFGLAKSEDEGLTRTGDVIGTLRYMAPERFRGECDAGADIYALGLTLFEMLAMEPAYDASDRMRLIQAVQSEELTHQRLQERRVPRDLCTIILKAIEKEPKQRYPSAKAMAEDLRRFLDDEPILARRTTTVERYIRWARRNPSIAILGAVLTAVLVAATAGSLYIARRMAILAEQQRIATVEAKANLRQAEAARKSSLTETYRATLNEVQSLRIAHSLGWRDIALRKISRLARYPTDRRDLAELRTEAVRCLGEFDLQYHSRIEGIDVPWAVDFAPDQRTLVTAHDGGELNFWDVERTKYLGNLIVPSKEKLPRVNSNHISIAIARFLSEGGLICNTLDRQIAYFEKPESVTYERAISSGNAYVVYSDVDRSGKTVAAVWSDRFIRVYRDGILHKTIPAETDRVALSADGLWIAYPNPTLGFTITLARLDKDEPPILLKFHRSYVRGLAFSPDGSTLASSSFDHTIVLWDINERCERLILRGHEESVVGVTFSRDGRWVATIGNDYNARIWDARDGRSMLLIPNVYYCGGFRFSQYSDFLAIGTHQNPGYRAVQIYQQTGLHEHTNLVGHRYGVQRLAFHPKLDRLISGADDHEIIVWDPETGKQLIRWEAHPSFITGLAYSPDGKFVVSSNGPDGTEPAARLWDAESGKHLRRFPAGHGYLQSLTFDPSGRKVAGGSVSGSVYVWDTETGQEILRLNLSRERINSLAFIEGGRKLVLGVFEGMLLIVDLETKSTVRQVPLPEGIHHFVHDATRNRLISSTPSGDLRTIELSDFKLGPLSASSHTEITSMSMTPDGSLLATGGLDRRVVLHDPQTFSPLLEFPRHTGYARDISFDATGNRIAIAGTDSVLSLWNLKLLRQGLSAIGIDWNSPAPKLATMEELTREDFGGSVVEVIRPQQTKTPVP